MKDNRTMKELFDSLYPQMKFKESAQDYIRALAYFTQGYGRGVLDTINQRREMEEESK